MGCLVNLPVQISLTYSITISFKAVRFLITDNQGHTISNNVLAECHLVLKQQNPLNSGFCCFLINLKDMDLDTAR